MPSFASNRSIVARAPWLMVAALACSAAQAAYVADANYCHAPGQFNTKPKPNVMVLLDNSGSMNNQAYAGSYGQMFNPNRTYYGYFDPANCYKYAASKFNPDPVVIPGENGFGNPSQCLEATNGGYPFSGNFLNWVLMTRIEVAKKVLIGGRVSGTQILFDTLADDRVSDQDYCFDPSPYTDLAAAPGFHIDRAGNNLVELRRLTKCSAALQYENNHTSSCLATHCHATTGFSGAEGAQLRVETFAAPTGVFHNLVNEARWGLTIFDNDGGADNGGEVVHYMGFNDNGASLRNAIETMVANAWTPTAEALYTVIRLFKQDPTNYFGEADEYTLGPANRDPYLEWEGSGTYQSCRKSFVLLITDGKPTQDLNIPVALRDFDADGYDPFPSSPATVRWPSGSKAYDWPPPGYPSWPDPTNISMDNGSEYLDDLALYAATTDLRSDIPDSQNIYTYVVFAFGDTSATGYEGGAALWTMWNTAINGAFVDKNGNKKPDLDQEWDENGDGWPDGFFLAEDGSEVEAAIYEAVAAILKRTSSASAAAILTESRDNEAMIMQAFYNPEEVESDGTTLDWVGYMTALWLKENRLRDDANSPGDLVLQDDRILGPFYFDNNEIATKVTLYTDDTGDNLPDAPDGLPVRIENLAGVFEAGYKLWEMDPDGRTIYTTLNGVARVDFDTGNEAILGLPMATAVLPSTETTDLIAYIRGDDIPETRNRTKEIGGTRRVWKLGDIIHSSPTVVQDRQSSYNALYDAQATSYNDYVSAVTDRRAVVYVGANDGMLHSFNIGAFVNEDPDPFDSLNVALHIDPRGFDIGRELWGFIPRSALPHLRWLAAQNYCHSYYVDNTPSVYDARIFADDAAHPKGWGTILMVATGLGCRAITVAGTTYRPSILVLDITDPLDPQPLLEFSDPNMGFATSQPRLARISDDSDPYDDVYSDCWYMVFGSGPTLYEFVSSQRARFYAVKLGGGHASCVRGQFVSHQLPAGIAGDTAEHVASPLVVDVVDASNPRWYNGPHDSEKGFSVEAIYLTTDTLTGANDHGGRIVRVNTDYDINPANWRLSTVFSAANVPFSVKLAAPPGNPDTSKADKPAVWLFAGSGRFHELTTDSTYNEVQYVFGIKDYCWGHKDFDPADCPKTFTMADLQNINGCWLDPSTQQFTASCTVNKVGGGGRVQSLSDLQDVIAQATKHGWYFPLTADTGERVVEDATVDTKTLFVASYTPKVTLGCSTNAAGGDARLYLLDYRSGAVRGNSPLTIMTGRIKPSKGLGSSIVASNDLGQILIETNPFRTVRIKGLTDIMRPVVLH